MAFAPITFIIILLNDFISRIFIYRIYIFHLFLSTPYTSFVTQKALEY